ncbi:hypothetical protein Nepgr_014823 [Nepenthes gracilis]|uniref:Uncharacterized protein n=1 Tax=Nepenthes gracilis TaxID=150966 RepID=A0AAD3SKS3_NEPGR|nr:hypothetical protein Nepgr_014823 [Nepenthes gracilis]
MALEISMAVLQSILWPCLDRDCGPWFCGLLSGRLSLLDVGLCSAAEFVRLRLFRPRGHVAPLTVKSGLFDVEECGEELLSCVMPMLVLLKTKLRFSIACLIPESMEADLWEPPRRRGSAFVLALAPELSLLCVVLIILVVVC